MLAIFVLLGALAVVLIPLLVLRANTQSFAARSDGGRDIHVFLQPQATGPEVNALQAEVAKAEGVSSDRVLVLPVSVEFSQEFGSAGNSLLPCCGKQNLTYYLDVMVTSPNRVSPVESGIIGRPAVLAVADAAKWSQPSSAATNAGEISRRRLAGHHDRAAGPGHSAAAVRTLAT